MNIFHITVHYQDTDNNASQKRIKVTDYHMDEEWLTLNTVGRRTIRYNRDRIISIDVESE